MPDTPTLINTAGEPEQEALSRRANAMEAFGVCVLILTLLWPFCYGIGVLGDVAWVRRAAEWALLPLILYVLFISHWIHRDTAETLGMGNPRRLWRMLCAMPSWKRVGLALIIGVVTLILTYAFFTEWPRVIRFLRMPRAMIGWQYSQLGTVAQVLFCTGLAALISTCAIRYDNFRPAFMAALKVSAVMIFPALIGAWLHRGSAMFDGFRWETYLLAVFAYVFWGFLQQLVFTSYLGTRLRKAFGPSIHPGNVVPAKDRLRVVLACAAGWTGLAAPVFWLIVRALAGPEKAPLAMLAWFAWFAFLSGALWGWFYCLDKKRLLVATLTGSFFGLIHIDSYGLVLVTFALGVVLSWIFMVDRTRNLVALGFIHGFLGSTFGRLFKNDGAGALRIDYRVGPWNIEEPTVYVIVFPLLCLAGYAALLWWSRRTREFAPDPVRSR